MSKALAAVLLATLGCAQAQTQSLTRHVDPFIGTEGTGHVTPGATVPFGMVFPSPDNADRGWSFSGGYQYRAPRILGFSNTHMSGVGIGDLGDVLLQPAQGQRWTAQTTDFSSTYDKASERARPGHYGVTLKDLGVRVDLTATERVAFQRYTFAKPGRVQVLVDLQHGILFGDGPRVTQSQHAVDAARGEITGTVHAKNWVERQTSFIVRFSQPIAEQTVLPPREGDKAPRLLLAFELGKAQQLEARVAVSTVDETGARANLDAIGQLRFYAARQKADAAWNRLLSRIHIEADAGTKRLFYSALYRTLLHPSNIADVDGRVRGPKGEVIQAPGGVYYSTLSLWDTFRASHPLYTLIVPERVPGFVSTLIAHQRQMGYLPLWTVMGRETHTMIGNPAMPVIADAIAKGFPVDREAALQAMLATSTQDRPEAPAWAQRSWQWLDQYGYLPFDKAPGEAVSKTAEYGYGDAALAQVARQMGRTELAERFARRAGSWQNLFDPSTQTLRGKDSQGRWREPFDPVVATSPMNNPGDYTEANAYQYTATPALHDPEGFRELLGGPEALGRWLERFFTLPVPNPDKHLGQEALIGQYAHGNEPSHHIAWLYAFSDRPAQGHARVAEVVRRFYSARPDGIVGNDDAGQMSAWLVFAMLGFYPAQPASGQYVLGQPLVRGATLQLADGRRLRLSGSGPVARLNGTPVAPTALPHAGLVRGGTLVWGP